MNIRQKINQRIVDKFAGGADSRDIRQQLDSLVPEDRLYALKHLPNHMVNAGRWEQLQRWLTDYDFIQAKVAEVGVQESIEDYDRVENLESEKALRPIQRTLGLSAHILREDTTQLAEQLWGRLLSLTSIPQIKQLLEQAKQRQNRPWLRPIASNLTPPTSPLIRTLTGHTSIISAVALTPDGTKVVSGSMDKNPKSLGFIHRS